MFSYKNENTAPPVQSAKDAKSAVLRYFSGQSQHGDPRRAGANSEVPRYFSAWRPAASGSGDNSAGWSEARPRDPSPHTKKQKPAASGLRDNRRLRFDGVHRKFLATRSPRVWLVGGDTARRVSLRSTLRYCPDTRSPRVQPRHIGPSSLLRRSFSKCFSQRREQTARC